MAILWPRDVLSKNRRLNPLLTVDALKVTNNQSPALAAAVMAVASPVLVVMAGAGASVAEPRP